jgi:uncharacterized protein (TIGR03435 family)
VEDRTGLDGRFDFHLDWNPGLRDGEPLISADERAADALLAAVQEQLGLKLEQHGVPANRYTIERAEKPAEN